MDKEFIISEIHRTAKNGKALGQNRFTSETGIKEHEWRGKYWARWGDALNEAGYSQNAWNTAYEEAHILESLLRLTRKLGKYPTKHEINLAQKSDSSIPGEGAISRLCNRATLKKKLLEYCHRHENYADLEEIISAIQIRENVEPSDVVSNENVGVNNDGYVYLVSAQDAYKIGSTRAPYRRVAEIANQSAKGAELLHTIATDDPEGIENYWHRRFDAKRIDGINKQSGEWFQISKEDIKAFKRRKTM
jgi:hypothetical protein